MPTLIAAQLAAAARRCAAAAGNPATTPILSFARVRMTGSGFSLAAQGFDAAAEELLDCDDEGLPAGYDRLVPARLLAAVAARLPAAENVDVAAPTPETLRLRCGAAEYLLRTALPNDYPDEIPGLSCAATPDTTTVHVDARAVRDALRQVLPAAATNNPRQYLNAVALDGQHRSLATTDGHLLLHAPLPDALADALGDRVLLVPRAAAMAMAALLDDHDDPAVDADEALLGYSACAALSLRCNNSTYTARLYEGAYPHWHALTAVPAGAGKRAACVPVPALAAAIKAALPVCVFGDYDPLPPRVHLHVHDATLYLHAATAWLSEPHAAAITVWEGCGCATMPRLVLPAARPAAALSAGAGDVTITPTGDEAPVVLAFSARPVCGVLMPVRE